MKVEMLNYTREPERTIACAGKLCYSKKSDIATLWDSLTEEEVKKFIKTLIDNRHESPLEHSSFTFAIEDVSRSLMAQITRHRICSFSIRSQRYCNEGEFKAIVPDAIAKNEKSLVEFNSIMDALHSDYKYLQEVYGISNEDARALLPNACATRMIMTMNARELMHFFNERCCNHAQLEIRTLAYKMLKLVKEVAPTLFSKAGAKCESLGYCPETLRSCGRKPTLDKILEVYNNAEV